MTVSLVLAAADVTDGGQELHKNMSHLFFGKDSVVQGSGQEWTVQAVE